MTFYLIVAFIFTILAHSSTQQKQCHDRRVAQLIRAANPYPYILAAPPKSTPPVSGLPIPPSAPEWQPQVSPTIVYQQPAPSSDLSMVLKVAETLNSYHEKVRASNTLNPEDIINKLINALVLTSTNTKGEVSHKSIVGDIADLAVLQVSSCVETDDCEKLDSSSSVS